MEQISSTWNNNTSFPSGVSTILFANFVTALLQAQYNVTNSNTYPEDINSFRDEYDFIVVGGGSAGAVVASRLSEVPDWNVLLIEAGGDPEIITDIPAFYSELQNTNFDWKYKSGPDENVSETIVNKQFSWPCGKVLGGSSTINGMVYVRGRKWDYNNWESLGNVGWGYEDVLPYFKLSEDMQDPDILKDNEKMEYHGTGGYLPVNKFRYKGPLVDAILEASKEIGYKIIKDNNADEDEGFGEYHTTTKDGVRYSTAKSFLSPVKDRRNLHVTKYSTVRKVIVNPESKVAEGVQFLKNGTVYEIKVSKEIVISAGSVNSAQILMLSGIGPKQHLLENGVSPVIHDLKVGYNLQNHFNFLGYMFGVKPSVQNSNAYLNSAHDFLVNRKGPLTGVGTFAASAFYHSRNNPRDLPTDMELLFVEFPVNDSDSIRSFTNYMRVTDEIKNNILNLIKKSNIVVVFHILNKSQTKGRILLRNKDPVTQPKIADLYLRENEDVERIADSVEILTNLVNSERMRKEEAKVLDIGLPACKDTQFGSRDYWRCAIRQVSVVAHHPAGTCKMGPPSDSDAVVDPQLKIYGIKGLRVIDASIMPVIINGNTMAPAIMIGEKGADMIKEEWFGQTNVKQHSEL